MRRRRRLLHLLSVCALSMAVVAAGLPGQPWTPSPAFADDGVELAPAGPPPGPLSDANRVPVVADIEQNGVVAPEDSPPDPDHASTPEGNVSDNAPLPEEGSPSFDVYAAGTPGAGHLALVYRGVVNEQTNDGSWVPIDPVVTTDETGWAVEAPRYSAHLPSALGPGTPISFTNSRGTLSSAPQGIDPAAPVNGTYDGTSVTYAQALPGIDLRYTPTPQGLKEDAVLASMESGSSFSYDLATSG